MATYTTNYNLKKPEGTDFYNIADFNGNADILDAALKTVADNAAFTALTKTLTAGSTSVTFTDSAITTTATIDFYTSVFGVNPTAVEVSSGSLTMTFSSQATDVSVKVVIR